MRTSRRSASRSSATCGRRSRPRPGFPGPRRLAWGKYLRELAEAGRLLTFEFPKRGFPPQLGDVVVTTNHPDPKKAVDAKFLAGLLRGGTSFVLVFGLGPHGLDDRDVEALGRYHFDLTGRGLVLETATAIGAAPAIIAAHLDS